MQKIILKLGIKIIEGLMNKQLTQQNLEELSSERRILQLMRLTLINILNAKGLYYRKYQLQYQQKRQSNQIDYLPMKF